MSSGFEWPEFFQTARVQALHLEMRDAYGVAEELQELDLWKRTGQADTNPDAEGWRPWTTIARDAIARGVVLRRARIVSEPVTDYTRWLHRITETNLAVGELVRWLPRAKASDLCLPGNDFWVLDHHSVLFNHWTGYGDLADPATELRHEPELIKMCTAAFEAVWDRATPHEEYQVR
ncbi:DUF6879 family protein [Streptacidiphilus albus]|uniref:DUF6879 family protein n=1 Tax=Streptacidiphilus albus TaxID=105425 RepID=UPI00054B612D|nr:DUF6879 family protein [Streptacidiphilus albus]